jgi:hypothetical protein
VAFLVLNTPAGDATYDGTPAEVISKLDTAIQKYANFPNSVALYTAAKNAILQQDQKYTTEYDIAKQQVATAVAEALGTNTTASKAVADEDAGVDNRNVAIASSTADEGGRET